MKFLQTVVAAAALTVALGAHAQVTGSLGGGGGSFASLSSAGLGGGSIATLSGGTVYSVGNKMAALPDGTVGNFLAAGTTSGLSATLSFAGLGLDYVSFLWGSPDTYNRLVVTTTGGVQTAFNSTGLGLNSPNKAAEFVQFSGTGGSLITGLTFFNQPNTNAFEVADFSVTSVPEPQTYALLAAGLGAVVFVSRRRQS
jgi:PEP-CTERM motif